jgi:hypothetical protein
MKTLVSAAILLITVTNATAQAPIAAQNGTLGAAPVQPVQPTSSADDQARQAMNATLMLANRPGASDLEDQARQTVLVVPGPDLKNEALAAISEDMTVMCRIFDKALYSTGRSVSGAGALRAFTSTATAWSSLCRWISRWWRRRRRRKEPSRRSRPTASGHRR